MADKVESVTIKQVRLAARNHTHAMTDMYEAHNRVAITLAVLVAMMGRADDAPCARGTLASRADKALGELGRAYERVAALFDE